MTRTATAVLEFDVEPITIGSTTIARLPQEASARLPSRGQVAVRGSVDGRPFETVLEPDGLRGHWMKLDADLPERVSVEVEVRTDWPEPDVPADLAEVLADAPGEIQDVWSDITPMARWEWVRWVNATANPATRRRRVEVSISKMANGKRRPCCFDLSACTDPSVSTSGKLRVAD